MICRFRHELLLTIAIFAYQARLPFSLLMAHHYFLCHFRHAHMRALPKMLPQEAPLDDNISRTPRVADIREVASRSLHTI